MSDDLKNFTVRARNVLECMEIYSVGELIGYYKSEGGFLKTRNCGKITKVELEQFCQGYLLNNPFDVEEFESGGIIALLQKIIFDNRTKYENKVIEQQKFDIIRNDFKLIAIDDLGFSVRTTNCCYRNSTKNLAKLLKYYSSNKSFLKWKNMGVKSNEELVRFCENKLEESEMHNDQNNKKITNYIDLDKFEEGQLSTLDYCFNLEVKKEFLGQLKIIIEKLIENGSNFADIYNLFVNSEVELKSNFDITDSQLENITFFLNVFKKDVLTKINLNTFNFSEFDRVEFRNTLSDIFDDKKLSTINNEFPDLYEKISNSKFEIFNFMFYSLNKFTILKNKTANFTYLNRSNYFENIEKLTLEEIGKMFKVTRERIRQIYKKPLYQNIFDDYLKKISHFLNHTNFKSIKNEAVFIINGTTPFCVED